MHRWEIENEVEDRHRMRIRVHVHAMQMRTYCLFALRLHVARAAFSSPPIRCRGARSERPAGRPVATTVALAVYGQ